MKSSLSLLLVLLAAPLAFSAPPPAPTPLAEQPAASPTASPTATPKPRTSAEKEDAIFDSVPVNQPIKGLTIPNRDASGKLLMLFNAESATRLGASDRDIEFQGLKMEIHNNDGSTFNVDMKHSLFNLDTRILTSDTPTTIRRDDFVIKGDRAEFHTKEKFGRVIGHVRMIIYNSGNPQ